MAEEVRNLGDILNSELGGCAYFCHISSEIACITSAYELSAPANKVCGAKQRAGGGKSWPWGVQKLAPPPRQMKGVKAVQWCIRHHEGLKPF